jgi:hypothetical protein
MPLFESGTFNHSVTFPFLSKNQAAVRGRGGQQLLSFPNLLYNGRGIFARTKQEIKEYI